MQPLPTRPDVVIIGAGAAGIAAGRELRRLGVSALILEARERIGGRAWTVPHGDGPPLDLGCEWLHSGDQNVLAGMAQGFGFGLDKSEPPWARLVNQTGFGPSEQADFRSAHAAFETRMGEAALTAEGGRDRAAAELLAPDGRWNGMLDAISTYYNGAPLARVSVLDYSRYRDTDADWRVIGGYGALIAATADGLPIQRGCVVRTVDATRRVIAVGTSHGAIEADAVIVTVPASVLASGAIAFTPEPRDHLAAAAVLPLGLADKLYFALDDPDAFQPDTRVIGAPDRRDSGSYTLRPRGRPMIEGYFGGDYARSLEKGGLSAFVEAARGELAAALGHDVLRRLTPVLATAWAQDPLSLGSYSHALPGHADARAALATPFEDRILFAGEATSPYFFSTAHGAFESGLHAAQTAAAYCLKSKSALA